MKHSGLSVFLLVGLAFTPAFAFMSGGSTHYMPDAAQNQTSAGDTGKAGITCSTPPQQLPGSRPGELCSGKGAVASNHVTQPVK